MTLTSEQWFELEQWRPPTVDEISSWAKAADPSLSDEDALAIARHEFYGNVAHLCDGIFGSDEADRRSDLIWTALMIWKATLQ